MHALPEHAYGPLLQRYLGEPAFFPLVAAVLEGSQNGMVLVDDASHPRQAFVEHAFGFAQIFGKPVPGFEVQLAAHIAERDAFQAAKLRLYTPPLPAFLLRPEFAALRSERQRFILASPDLREKAHEAEPATDADLAQIEDRFGIVRRFWPSAEEFLRASRAQVVRRNGIILAVCYAAAIGGGRAEIDVVTDPAYRQQGLGRQVAIRFMRACLQGGLQPVWDCFTNNLPSVRTAISLGFIPKGAPYAFFTIPRA